MVLGPDSPLEFELFKTSAGGSRARVGRVTTRHGSFETPAFMPVGTQGTVKGLLPSMVRDAGAEIILSNTYHLMLRPTEKVVAAMGGLQRFTGWGGPMLTDSGGFQVFSLSDISHIGDDGVVFKSHIDGAKIELTPRRSIEVQNALGADIIMAFDECPSGVAAPQTQVEAVERTCRWAELCLAAHQRKGEQSLFGIVQGGSDLALREQCVTRLIGLDFPGYAIGGLAVGEGFDAMVRVLNYVTPMLPVTKPRYLMGVGMPRDILAAVAAGVDMFDCSLPTRNGRNAYAFTADGPLRIRNAKFTRDERPLEAGCDCVACRDFSRAALRHFFFAGEMLGPILVSAHNTRFYQRLMAEIRRAILAGTFEDLCSRAPENQTHGIDAKELA